MGYDFSLKFEICEFQPITYSGFLVLESNLVARFLVTIRLKLCKISCWYRVSETVSSLLK